MLRDSLCIYDWGQRRYALLISRLRLSANTDDAHWLSSPCLLQKQGLTTSIDQTDLALRRRFDLTERLKLNVRAEYFNVFNHPMFGPPGSQRTGQFI